AMCFAPLGSNFRLRLQSCDWAINQGRTMRIIALMNQKGGVGKTTSSVNIAAGLARQGRKVCLIDLDPQAHASLHVGVDATGSTRTIYQVFAGARQFDEIRELA